MLRYYAERLTTVEINNTFYRMPKAELLSSWAGQVPEDFVFVLKGSQRITHMKRLKDAGESVALPVRGRRRPGRRGWGRSSSSSPYFKKDCAAPALLPGDPAHGTGSIAFEFRHESWFDDEVYASLRETGAALCAADTDESGDEGAAHRPDRTLGLSAPAPGRVLGRGPPSLGRQGPQPGLGPGLRLLQARGRGEGAGHGRAVPDDRGRLEGRVFSVRPCRPGSAGGPGARAARSPPPRTPPPRSSPAAAAAG